MSEGAQRDYAFLKFLSWIETPGVLHQINLRRATINDLSLLKHWDEQPHIIDSDPNDDWNWEVELQRRPEWRQQLIAEVDGCPIGFLQIIDPAKEDSHYWGNTPDHLRAIDIWIGEEENLGKGYGTVMMHKAIDLCFDEPGVTTIVIDPLVSNIKARRFYERLGFEFVELRWFNKDHCAIYKLDRPEWNKIKHSRYNQEK